MKCRLSKAGKIHGIDMYGRTLCGAKVIHWQAGDLPFSALEMRGPLTVTMHFDDGRLATKRRSTVCDRCRRSPRRNGMQVSLDFTSDQVQVTYSYPDPRPICLTRSK